MFFDLNRCSCSPVAPYIKNSALALAVMLACGLAHAQAESVANSSGATKPTNGFAQTLNPTVKKRATTKDTAYAPVKNDQDGGQTPEIEMFVGESRVFPAPGVGRIAVGNGQILTAAALEKKEILLFANQAGTSSLFIWNEDGRYQRLKINIVPGDTSRIGREIASFLSSIPGTRASIVGDKVIIEGERISAADMDKLKKLEQTYPQIVNFTSTQGWEKMVMMDVKVVEFPRSEMQELGLKWAPTGGGTVAAVWAPFHVGKNGPYQINIPAGDGGAPVTDPNLTTTTLPLGLNVLGGLNMGLNTQLNALAQEGKAAVLAEPQLSARSGSKANFLAGGEFPYVVSTLTGPVVNFKQYGIKLDITPFVDRDGFVSATVETEVSSIDASVSTPEGPALKKRSTKTEFNVKSGETMVLSGMLSRDNSTNVDKVPFLGDIPFIGALFRSKRHQNNETELVIFVTPVVVDAQSPGLRDRVEQTKQRLSQQFGPAPYLTDALQPGRDAGRPEIANQQQSSNTESSSAVEGGHRTVPLPIEQKPVTESTARVSPNATRFVAGDQNPLATPASDRVSNGGANLRVMLEGLALRAGPDAHSPVLMRLGNGSVVRLGDQTLPPELASSWRNVTVGDVNGFVVAKWVAPTSRAATSGSRGGPAASEAQSGKKLGSALMSREPSALMGGNGGAASHPYRVVLPKLAMRVTPDINAEIVMQIPEGALVTAQDSDARGGWLPVDYSGKRGWVAAQWLESQP